MDQRLIARLLRQGGGKLLDVAVERLFPARPKAGGGRAKKTVGGAVAGKLLPRLLTRSVPAAILIGGGVLAKLAYDRKKAREQDMAEDTSPPDAP